MIVVLRLWVVRKLKVIIYRDQDSWQACGCSTKFVFSTVKRLAALLANYVVCAAGDDGL